MQVLLFNENNWPQIIISRPTYCRDHVNRELNFIKYKIKSYFFLHFVTFVGIYFTVLCYQHERYNIVHRLVLNTCFQWIKANRNLTQSHALYELNYCVRIIILSHFMKLNEVALSTM